MKKEIFLSFKPDFFRPILYGIKKYEYRKRFTSEPVIAYLYLSAPVQEVIGIMDLGEALRIQDVSKTTDDPKVLEVINSAIDSGDKLAIPIYSFTLFKKPIPLEKIKELYPDFFVPHSYIYLKNKPELLNYLRNQEKFETEFLHKHDGIYYDNFGVSCLKMEQTEEFKKLDKLFTKTEKNDIIKSKYLLRRD